MNKFPNGAGYHDYEDVGVDEELVSRESINKIADESYNQRRKVLNDFQKEVNGDKENIYLFTNTQLFFTVFGSFIIGVATMIILFGWVITKLV